MLTLSSAELNTWIASLLWPMARILGLIATAPVFGNLSVPIRIKAGFGLMLSLIIAPTVPALPAADPMSLAGLLILTQQTVIGLAMGFAMRIVFAAAETAGEVIGLTMGFGFALFYDPQTHGRTPAISQFLSLLTLMIFLAVDAHLTLLAALAESFVSLPISGAPFSGAGFQEIAKWGGVIFMAGMQLALPVVAALLLTNIALGVLTKAAPQLNLFGIGFPITLSAGFIMLLLTLPFLATPLGRLFQEGMEVIRQVLAGATGLR